VLGGGSPGGQAASLGRGAGGGGATARLRKLAQLFGFSPPVTYFSYVGTFRQKESTRYCVTLEEIKKYRKENQEISRSEARKILF
jgi:hypothetical protein